MANNFRVESLTRLTPAPPCAQVVLPRAVAGVVRAGNPYARLASPGVLLAAIEDMLKHIGRSGASQEDVASLLKHYGDFAAQANDAAQLKALQQRVLTAAFDERYFKQSRGGDVREHCKR